MDPVTKLALITDLAPLIGLVALLAIGGWVFTTWLRVRNGYPLENSWGQALHRQGPTAGDKQIAELAEQNRRLVSEMGEMRQRVAVLERLATDPAHRLDREIAGLSTPANLN